VLERIRRRRRLAVVAIAVAAVAVASAILLRPKNDYDPCAAPRQAPSAETALLPKGLSFEQVGQVTHVLRQGRNVIAQAVTSKPIDEVTVLIQDAVTAAGYRPAGMDNEGFEAEVFFDTGRYAAGQARVRKSACKGRWEIGLVLLDRH
jgi:hypothetical protein